VRTGGAALNDWRSLRFGRAAASYHEATPIQLWMAERLLGLLATDATPPLILELGCGTGHLTRRLAARFPHGELVATDLSEPMLREAETIWPPHLRRPRWEILDARTPSRADIRPALVASNALVQWFTDLAAHFRSVRSLTTTGATYLVSGFRRDHFPELEAILGSAEFGYAPGPGHATDEAVEAAERSGWKALVAHEESMTESYPAAIDFLRHLKASGANRPPPEGRPLTRSRLQRLVDRLTREAASPQGIAITWKPWFLRLEAV
jgi:malonyl-ACP O-methyltransferase BioC